MKQREGCWVDFNIKATNWITLFFPSYASYLLVRSISSASEDFKWNKEAKSIIE